MTENNSRIDLLEAMVNAVTGKGTGRAPAACGGFAGSVPGGLRERAADLLPGRASPWT